MDLLDKFDTVEVKADRRISDKDKAFCVAQHEAYVVSVSVMVSVAEAIEAACEEQQRILSPIYGKDYSSSNSYLNFGKLNAEHIRDAIQERHSTFIRRIVRHFAGSYHVDLSDGAIREHLIPPEPEKPEYNGWRFKNEDKFLEEYRKKMEIYNAEKAEYDQKLLALDIPYETVVDEIFQQLGGFSFEERSTMELKKSLYDCFHYGRYSTNAGEETFEIKGQTLKLRYGCSCKDWYSSPPFELREDTKALLRGIAHYEHGDTSLASFCFPEVMGYNFRINDYAPNSSKVEKIKCFKNGRVDIKFVDAATCNDFVDRYLRTEITEV